MATGAPGTAAFSAVPGTLKDGRTAPSLGGRSPGDPRPYDKPLARAHPW